MTPATAPAQMPAPAAVMIRAGTENFPVASRLLGRRLRRHLLAIYGFARLVDQLGDELPGDRPAALDWLEQELDRAFAGSARHPLLAALEPTLHECALPRAPFVALIDANRMDQRVTRYATWEQLRGYCELSANPVGRLVLGVLGLATPERTVLSDDVCTALQLVEHMQDVGEDAAAGRIYMPADEMERCGCVEGDLRAARTSRALRDVLAIQGRRADDLLARGSRLVSMVEGRPRLAIAAFVAGGRTALRSMRRADYEVLAGRPRPRRGEMLMTMLRVAYG